MSEMFVANATLELPSKKSGDPDPIAVEVMKIAEQVLADPTGLVAVYNTGSERIRVGHSRDPDVSLVVTAQRAKKLHLGVHILFAHLLVKDESGDMSLYLERRKLREYSLSGDPFVDLILSHFTTHLGN
jgi:hypothetical protein